MGGRGGGSPAQASSATVGERESRQINITVIDKPSSGPWRIIGDAPESLVGPASLVVSRTDQGKGFVVRNSVTDEVMARGRTVSDTLRNLSNNTNMRVNYFDETASGRLLNTWG